MSRRDDTIIHEHRCALEPLEPRVLLSGTVLSGELNELLGSGEWRPEPPPGYVYVEAPVIQGLEGASKIISNVPEYFWTRGCSPTSAAMVFGYWDGVAYPNYFPGDASTQTAAVTECSAPVTERT